MPYIKDCRFDLDQIGQISQLRIDSCMLLNLYSPLTNYPFMSFCMIKKTIRIWNIYINF